MPITAITGLPGHGKTLYAIARLKELSEKEGRPIFQHGVTGIKLSWPAWSPDQWESLEAGSVLLIDEAWQIFPVRARGGDVPSWIGNLAKHRHKGVDIWIVTQDPMLIDVFVRRLVDRHFHVIRKFGTHFATIHEFPNGIREQSSKNREGSIRHEWRYPKALFDAYQSAELHTVKRRIPARIWLLVAAPILALCFGFAAWWRLRPSQVAAQGYSVAASASQVGRPAGAAPGGRQVLTTGEFVAQYAPRIPGLPHTAPVYDDVTRPTDAPYPAACLASSARCGCYTQQATRMDTPDDLCRRIAAGGFFVSWNLPVAQAYPVQAAIPAPGPDSGQAGGFAGFRWPAARPGAAAAGAPLDDGPPQVKRAPPGR